MITSHACLGSTVVIDSERFMVDLICLPLKGLDVILGMDWLHANKVFLNCCDKKVMFVVSEHDDERLSSAKRIQSAMKG